MFVILFQKIEKRITILISRNPITTVPYSTMSNNTIKKEGNVITLSGPDMTNDFQQMKRKCCGRYDNFIFPDAKKVVDLLKEQGRSPMTHEQIIEVHGKGTHTEYYDTIYCYYCVNKNNYKNYMFSPDDAENKDNHYQRLRMGVLSFGLEDDFDVWIIKCA
tara:strand:+ start:3774 stop:4256 length:483 start_codon:yes stop_codon:yes gene_type:complete